MRIAYYKRIILLCISFSLVFTLANSACYAEEIIVSTSPNGVDEGNNNDLSADPVVGPVPDTFDEPIPETIVEPLPAPVAGAEKDLAQIFDLEKITTVQNEGEKIEDIIPAAKSVEPVLEQWAVGYPDV